MDDAAFDYTKSSFKADESGKFPKLTLSDIILKEGQYQPAFKDPTKTEGTIAPEFLNITDKDTAILAMKSYFDKRGDKRSMKDIEKLFDQTAKDLQNEKLIKSAQEHVGGNTEFLSGDNYQKGDAYRGESGVDNTFFSKYGSGDQVESGAAPSPLISPNIKSKIQNKELSQNIGEPPEDDNMSTEILPPIGGDGDTTGLQQSAPNFGSASIASEQLSDTSSMIPFIDVISNQYLSIV